MIQTLDKYVHSGVESAQLLKETMQEHLNAIGNTERSATPENAYQLCKATRSAYWALAAYCLHTDNTEELQQFLPQLHHVKDVLKSAAKCNPENAEYIKNHQKDADRAISLASGIANAPLVAPRRHVFISYVRENSEDVERLRNDLVYYGINVWLDRDRIRPGMRWKSAIRDAIASGEYFIAVFSEEYCDRDRTFMNEELIVAVEELRQRARNREWFISVKLSPCGVPDFQIGPGETLRDLHYVDLFKDWPGGIRAIVNVLL